MTGGRLRIEGRGPVAMALRLFLARQGFDPASVQAQDCGSPLPAWLSSRPLALSLGSWQLLGRIVSLPACAPIRSVDVSLAGRSGNTRIRAADLDAPSLGCVVRYGDLHRALARALMRIEGREPIADGDVEVVVVADGETRTAATQHRDWRVHDFGQSALLTEVLADGRADGVAFERFTEEGPLALLPLPEAHRHAVVWCATHASTARRATLPVQEFDAELRAAFGPRLGALHVDAPRHESPLQRRIGIREDDARRVCIGNAAQTLHPVAGQGLNLGLRDAFELAQRLGEARGSGRPLEEAVARYRRSRMFDRALTVGVTDTLARVFTLRALAPLQSGALGALDLAAPLRNGFARALMFGTRSH